VTTDLTGFAAATYLRGVAWAALPTSLLGMADASLGGKTGADLPQGKNLIGAFYPPRFVLADPHTLRSLPERELRSGLGEVLKHGVISDPALFARCLAWAEIDNPAGRLRALDEIVRRAMAVKIQVIETDPFEQGRRAVLNLGHTIGHALELASGFALSHGEAVGLGMLLETRMAEQIGVAEPGLAKTVQNALQKIGLPTQVPPELDGERIAQAVGQDKKRASGKVRFALPVRIGEARVGIEFEDWRRVYERSLGPEWAEPESVRDA
jgi:3-dehydroquinate synthetase